ncbi:MAG: hypothetical protein ACHQ49_02645 [Elusimicrobiota bacterium]
MNMFRIAVAVSVLFGISGRAAFAASSSLDCLHFLVGAWSGDSTGADHGTGFFRFEPKMGGKVLLRTNHADYPAQDGRPASVHDDFMAIESGSSDLKATYVDNEGNAILYSVRCGGDEKSAVFLSRSEPGYPQFRLSYSATNDGALAGLFEIAPPGGDFSPYKRWTGRPRR